MFRFKQFNIKQDLSAMKVGTDGVLLGAWVEVPNATYNILDIGTGTGLIALQMAQRTESEIDAIEPNNQAFEEAVYNFEHSDWADRLFCYHANFSQFVEEFENEQTYDLIVTNPPYHPEDYRSQNKNRDIARHQNGLPLEQLIQDVSKLLSAQGEFAIVLPFNQEKHCIDIAQTFKLYPRRLLRVRGHQTADIKRSLIQFSTKACDCNKEELVIEISRHNYTSDYIKLVKPFYLKL